jgi:hypothetical protein
MTLKEIYFEQICGLPLGADYKDLGKTPDRRYIFGGVAWPDRRPGFAAVALMDTRKHFDGHDICLLAEFESFSIRELIRQIAVLDDQYMPDRWVGDRKNDAADKFLREVDMDGDKDRQKSKFMLVSTPLLEMENFYRYALDEIKRLLTKDKRMLFLKQSKVIDYLAEIEEDQISELKYGDFPAIEALIYAVVSLQRSVFREQTTKKLPVKQDRKYKMKAGVLK